MAEAVVKTARIKVNQTVVVPALNAVIPAVSRDPSPCRGWIAGQAREDCLVHPCLIATVFSVVKPYSASKPFSRP